MFLEKWKEGVIQGCNIKNIKAVSKNALASKQHFWLLNWIARNEGVPDVAIQWSNWWYSMIKESLGRNHRSSMISFSMLTWFLEMFDVQVVFCNIWRVVVLRLGLTPPAVHRDFYSLIGILGKPSSSREIKLWRGFCRDLLVIRWQESSCRQETK